MERLGGGGGGGGEAQLYRYIKSNSLMPSYHTFSVTSFGYPDTPVDISMLLVTVKSFEL